MPFLKKVAVQCIAVVVSAWALLPLAVKAQAQKTYAATVESLNQHPLPGWFDDAKLGIFVHWGLYSVPGWAPVSHPDHDFASQDYIHNNPYAEWYYNSMRLEGSPTWKYHREHFGPDYNYYNFADAFDRESQKWDADAFARTLRDAGAKYVVLTTKHHEGFTLWPSAVANPSLPADRQHATRDLVEAMSGAVTKQGMKLGLYYSGGYDWTFVPGPITKASDYETVKPQSEAYGKYVDAQYRELIERYRPSVLWNDIDYPKSGHPLEIQAEYYNAVPDGVVDDRFGIAHRDYTSPEYTTLTTINSKKWEECRGLGQSFGYNRAEGEEQTIAPDKLVALLVDIVSKNGNLLLDVGPEADGTIPAVQVERLRALGAWLKQNGDAIYGSRPWTRAEGSTAEGIPLRFTRNGTILYIILLARPKAQTVTLKDLSPTPNARIVMLGDGKPLSWLQKGQNVSVKLPAALPGDYAFVLRVEGGVGSIQ